MESKLTEETITITVTSSLVRCAKVMASNYAQAIGADPPEFYLDYYLNIQPHLNFLYSVGKALQLGPRTTVVEIGSGMGTRCMLGNAIWKARFIGVEPHPNTYAPLQNAIKEFRESNTAYSYDSLATSGEDTGLPPACVDVVLSSEVLEHVQNPERVVLEMYRILKPGGRIFVSTCSYASFYEGHYRSLWIPFFRRRAGRLWIRYLGYNPTFLNEINFITRRKLVRYFQKAGFEKIRLGWHFPWETPPPLTVVYPEGFDPHCPHKRKSFWQGFVQRARVHKLLSILGMEYKIYLEAVKPC
jgi:SAM-dependent methyltransferase